jgi:hypothetical protein
MCHQRPATRLLFIVSEPFHIPFNKVFFLVVLGLYFEPLHQPIFVIYKIFFFEIGSLKLFVQAGFES